MTSQPGSQAITITKNCPISHGEKATRQWNLVS